MIIKEADGRVDDIAALERLLARADHGGRRKIADQIRNIRAGVRSEDEAAYEMKVHYAATANWMVLHDLRIEHDGLVAQIDHLLINRLLEFWVCESKSFAQAVTINEHGEFTSSYAGQPYGLASPIEQNARHKKFSRNFSPAGRSRCPAASA